MAFYPSKMPPPLLGMLDAVGCELRDLPFRLDCLTADLALPTPGLYILCSCTYIRYAHPSHGRLKKKKKSSTQHQTPWSVQFPVDLSRPVTSGRRRDGPPQSSHMYSRGLGPVWRRGVMSVLLECIMCFASRVRRALYMA